MRPLAYERSKLFDREAERFDRCRPTYPDALIDELLGPGPAALNAWASPLADPRALSGSKGAYHLAGGWVDDGVPVNCDGWDRLVAVSHGSDEGSCVGSAQMLIW